MFTLGMIARFLNATTADGYNPYRVMRGGIEWEVPEPDNPWANIGYWSDHQIVYLQKLLEVADQFQPGALAALLDQPVFSYADVPYRIRPYAALLRDPQQTIDFDRDKQGAIVRRTQELGADGKLVMAPGGQVLHVTLAEKLLVLLLAKLTNLVPEGGIWMNTQRPEWNDANNALVGKGLSVVTPPTCAAISSSAGGSLRRVAPPSGSARKLQSCWPPFTPSSKNIKVNSPARLTPPPAAP